MQSVSGQERYEKVESNATSEQRVMGRPLNRYETESDLKEWHCFAKKLKVLDEDFDRNLQQLHCVPQSAANSTCLVKIAVVTPKLVRRPRPREALASRPDTQRGGRCVETAPTVFELSEAFLKQRNTALGDSERGTPDVHSHRNGLRRRDWNTYGVQFPCSSAEPYAPRFHILPSFSDTRSHRGSPLNRFRLKALDHIKKTLLRDCFN
ncbi:hypothetical protein EVAR_96649_1 [Eumeta japonica]|uniref:Uncharacterized protein n=1 Tax=Eumeta variegata TaxID=151549 RepID=A0A4C2A3R5_EUMVA|nr:hypothetical protein EVAR_96649_1 [Eumeta japonica]